MRAKKMLAGMLAATMIVSNLPGTFFFTSKVAAEGTALDSTRELQLKFDGNISDTSKNAFSTSLKGTETYIDGVDGKALSLNGSTYLDLGTSGRLQPGNLTFSSWVMVPENLSGEHMLVWNKPSGNYAGDGWYLSILNDSVPLKISVGQRKNGDQPTEAYVSGDRSAFFPKGQWVHIAVTYDSAKKEACIYRNGVAQKVSYVNSNQQAIVANDTDHKYIGFNSPGYNGGFAKMAVDDLEVYSSVATKSEIRAIYSKFGTDLPEEEMTKEEAVAEDLAAIMIGKREVTEDITLPTEGENGSRITWESSNESLISKNGSVTRPAAGKEDEDVTLTATVSNEDYSKKKTFTLKVLSYSSMTTSQDFELDDVTVTDGYYNEAQEKDIDFLKELDSDRLLSNFRKTAGIDTAGKNCYNGWENSLIGGHTMGHYLSAAAQAVKTTGDKELEKKLQGIITGLKECQDKNSSGFLFGAKVIDSKNVEVQFDNVEQNKTNIITQAWVPWYTMHKLIAGLVDVYKYTGNKEALTIAGKLGDWTYARTSKWSDDTKNRVLGIEYGGMNDCLYELYKYTKNENHATAAHVFDQDWLFERVASGGKNILNGQHANTTIPKFLGALNRYRTLGDKKYLQYAEDFFDMVLKNHSYITGGNSQWEHFGEDKILDSKRTQCNCETCNTYNMLKLARELFKITGEKKYADYYETTSVNAIMSSINVKNGMTAYFQPMATGYFKVFQNPDLEKNQFWCCTGSGMENFTKLGDSIYYHTDSSLIINQYISSVLTWKQGDLKVTQETDIPNTDKATIKVNLLNGKSGVTKTFHLRIPDWIAGAPVVNVNGKETEAQVKGGYVDITREWKDGDTITMVLPMKVMAESLPDNGTVYAFKYGPVVLSAGLGTDDEMSTTTCGMWVTIPKTKVVGKESASPSDGARTVLDSETIKVSEGTVADYIENINNYLVKDKNSLSFKLTGTDHDLIFTPHYSKIEERYGIYWYFKGENVASEQKKLLAQKEEARDANAKLDVIECGYGQYENDELHDMQEKDSATDTQIRISRYAKAGGHFSYRMKVDRTNSNYLLCQFAKADNGKSIKITSGTTTIAEETLNYDGKEELYTKSYLIPDAVVQAAEKVTSKETYDVVRLNFESGTASDSARLMEFVYTQRGFYKNASIKSLSSSVGDVVQQENGFTVTVPTSVKEVELSTVIEDQYGLLYINGQLVNDAKPYKAALNSDTTTLTYKVFGEDQKTSKEYTVQIIKKDKPVEVKVGSITLTPSSMVMKCGESKVFAVKVMPETATNKNVVVVSSNEKVAKVDGMKVTAVAEGNAIITVTATDGSGVRGELRVTVAKPPVKEVKVSKITVSPSSKSILAGDSFSYKVTISPSNATNKKVVVKSSNTKVAKISGTKIIGVAPGKANITITSTDGSKKTAVIKVTVTRLAEPKNVKAVQQAERAAKITYSKVSGADGYAIYRSTKQNSGYKKIGTTKKTEYKDTKVSDGKTYYYKVVATKKAAAANSNMSKYAKVSMLSSTRVSLSSTKRGKMNVSWKKVSGASGYEVYTATGKYYKKAATIKSGRACSVQLKNQKSRKNLYVKVRAYKIVNGKKVYGVFSKVAKKKVR